MDLKHLQEEAQLKSVFNSIKFQTTSGQTAIQSFFDTLAKQKSVVLRRTNMIHEMRNNNKDCSSLWQKIVESDTVLEPYIDTTTDLTEQIEAEIFFTGANTKIFNSIPLLISVLLFLKIWVTPIMGLLLPILFFIAPYIILNLFMNIPIPWDTYMTMMKEFVFGIRAGQTIGLKQITQCIYLFTSFGQGMFQPVLTAQQTYKTDTKIREIGEAVNTYLSASTELFTILCSNRTHKSMPKMPTNLSAREAYWWFKENHLLFKAWRKEIGCIDVYYTFAKDLRWIPVSWSNTAELKFEHLSDLCIKEPVSSDIAIDGHNILTGPNRGGKSSFLRAVLQQVLFARVFGVTSCKSMSLPWISWIHSRIRSLDMPGESSLFEEDVKSCAGILRNISLKNHGLVLIDELFHSTNPPDALFCSKTFLGDFWRYETVTSIISTHSFELLNSLPQCVKPLCCPAEEDPLTRKIKYTYRVEPGICKISSVREVLAEAGFLA
jgi:hypothetical protein